MRPYGSTIERCRAAFKKSATAPNQPEPNWLQFRLMVEVPVAKACHFSSTGSNNERKHQKKSGFFGMK
jgi:hypothetical protein